MKKRTLDATQGVSLRLTDRERECLEAVRKDVEARYALRFLARKAGCTDEMWIIAFVESVRAFVDQNAKQEPGPQDSRPEEVGRLAVSICRIAQRIRSLNKENFWDAECPAWQWDGMMPVHPDDRMDFENLPRALEMYARSVSIKAVRILRRREVDRDPRVGSTRYRAEQELLEIIQRVTGRKYRDKAASILRVVYPQFGLTSKIEGDSLRKREQRKRRNA
jgi:hypothetical protein